MADWDAANPAHALDNAWSALERETRKMADLGKHWDEATTTVRAKDRSLEMTFDGRGELIDLTFNTSKYRTMAPAQLASVIVETLREGREQAQKKVSDLMGIGGVPGLDLDGLVSGKLRPEEMLSSLMGPMFDTLNNFGVDAERPRPHTREDRGNG